jgi:hypothetical protein
LLLSFSTIPACISNRLLSRTVTPTLNSKHSISAPWTSPHHVYPPSHPDRHHLRCQPPTLSLQRRKSERGGTLSNIPRFGPTPALVIPSSLPTLFSSMCSFPGIKLIRVPLHHDRGMGGVMHRDAHEFLNHLFHKIVEVIQYDKHHKHQDKDKDTSSNASRENREFQAYQYSIY